MVMDILVNDYLRRQWNVKKILTDKDLKDFLYEHGVRQFKMYMVGRTLRVFVNMWLNNRQSNLDYMRFLLHIMQPEGLKIEIVEVEQFLS